MSIEKWLQQMSDEKKKPRHPEINFLPPLKMFLAFFDKEKESRQKKKKSNSEKQKDINEKDVEKLIEKLSEEDE